MAEGSFDSQVPFSLSTAVDGKLEKKVQANVEALLSQLKQGQKGTLTIKLELSRIPDTTTMIKISAGVKAGFPEEKMTGTGQMTGDFKLKVDKPREKVAQLTLADKPAANQEE